MFMRDSVMYIYNSVSRKRIVTRTGFEEGERHHSVPDNEVFPTRVSSSV